MMEAKKQYLTRDNALKALKKGVESFLLTFPDELVDGESIYAGIFISDADGNYPYIFQEVSRGSGEILLKKPFKGELKEPITGVDAYYYNAVEFENYTVVVGGFSFWQNECLAEYIISLWKMYAKANDLSENDPESMVYFKPANMKKAFAILNPKGRREL
ncbi:hypothetical protein GW765_03785 [Candidatus Parcubacteria bacterium]|nr:hypothetical protein [Candidatus Parcubacteria bacterium]